jgi:hypothetical protein
VVLAGVEVRHHSTRSSRRHLAGTAVAGEGRASGRDPGEAVHIQDRLGEGTDPAGAVGRTPGSPGHLVDHRVLGVGHIGADRTLAGPAARKVSMFRGTSTRGE